MLKKTSTVLKKCIVFFIDFSSIFRRKSMKNRVQSINNSLARKNQQQSTFGTPFFTKKTNFQSILGVPLGPRGAPGTSRGPSVFSPVFGWVWRPGPWRLQKSCDFHFKSYGFHFRSYGFHFKPYVFHFKPYNFHYRSHGWYCFYAMLTPLSSLSQLNN